MHVQVRDDDFARKFGRTEATIESKYRLWAGGVIGLAIFSLWRSNRKTIQRCLTFLFPSLILPFLFHRSINPFRSTRHDIYTVSFVSANIVSRNYQWKGEKNTNLAISVTMNFVLFFIFLMLQWSIIAIAIDYRIVFLLLK